MTLTMLMDDLTEVFPNWNVAPKPNGDYPEDVDVSVNKYSLFVAAAVNMGLLKMDDLTLLSDSGFGSDDDSIDDGSYEYYYYDDGTFSFELDIFYSLSFYLAFSIYISVFLL